MTLDARNWFGTFFFLAGVASLIGGITKIRARRKLLREAIRVEAVVISLREELVGEEATYCYYYPRVRTIYFHGRDLRSARSGPILAWLAAALTACRSTRRELTW